MTYVSGLFTGFVNMMFTLLNSFVTWLSFSSEIENMVDAVNHKIDEPPTRIGHRMSSHPGGFAKIVGKRRLNMAGAYIKISNDHAPQDAAERLTALKMLAEEALHAKTISMPLNTARVQIALMKKVVKSQGNKRRQMEAMSDFGLASYGNESTIRDFLKRNSLIEVPELDAPLKAIDMGWDDHVHDFLSEGRKTPTQVILDAFVKGISRLTLVHSTIDQPQLIHEAISAGNILGIDVQIGIEFSVGKRNCRRHYMYIPPRVENSQEFFRFFYDHHEALEPFLKGLRLNSEKRQRTMLMAMERFNTTMLPKINAGYQPHAPGWVPPLAWEDLNAYIVCGQVNRVHLGALLYTSMLRAFHARVLELKTQLLAAEERFRLGLYSEWEMKNVSSQYQNVRRTYETMSPEGLMSQYLDNREVLDYDSEFIDESPLLDTLRGLGGNILWIHPLELGLKEAVTHLVQNCHRLTHIETLNLRDSVQRNPETINLFSRFVHLFNNQPMNEVRHYLDQNDIQTLTMDEVEQQRHQMGERRLVPVCGSDSTGRDVAIPGMGFIQSSRIPEAVRTSFREHHFRLARPVAQLILSKGADPKSMSGAPEDQDIICMGKIGRPMHNSVGDEPAEHHFNVFRFWHYLNSTVKNSVRVAIGFAAALYWMNYQFALSIGLFFACLWFFITGFRNFLVDMIASSGTDFRSWSLKNVNFDNLAQSLYWTGFSVPLLGLVKMQYDELWPLEKSGLLFETAKFFFICFANGSYIMFHNRLRNFDRKVRRANFFRTMIAFPFATAFSSIGNAMGIPSIVQAKFWSDFVAGIIEGSGKFRQRFVLRQRDLKELLPRLYSMDRDARLTAMLDILYIWARQPRGKTCLAHLLLQSRSWWVMVKEWWYGRETPEEVRRIQGQYYLYYERICELYIDTGCLLNMTQFILNRFSGRDAVMLTKLVGEELETFRTWLRHLRSHYDVKKPELVDVKEYLPPALQKEDTFEMPQSIDELKKTNLQSKPEPTVELAPDPVSDTATPEERKP
ncbi:MAG TPA: hypothetical protein PKO06_00425 [Candidatus Ozemobacteraceae bacterium]|mgnify:CR=1 FL=1|nr:hypothetical protein [Candidatus Ozemobacteraceae bacterium]